MRLRGVNHVDLCVPDYVGALGFYDRVFGRLGYKSLGTLGELRAAHLEWEEHPAKAMWRKLPGRP